MNRDITVLYFSSSREEESFESKIRAKLLEQIGYLPLVSVTQKPLNNFGKNICVGIHDCCYANEFRQIQIGLQAIDTTWVLTAESDFLYPPEYFQFNPPEQNRCYRYANVWVCHEYVGMNTKKNVLEFRHKGFSDGCMMVDRKMWLDRINTAYENAKEWYNFDEYMPHYKPYGYEHKWFSENPAITFKTGNGVKRRTATSRRIKPVKTLPYWGSIEKVKKEMFE